MKAKVFLFACLLIGITTLSVHAQDKANNADQGWVVGTYWAPVFCDGVMVDYLEGGTIMVHFVFRIFKNGKLLAKEIDQVKGEVMSSSGETFTIREVDKFIYEDNWVLTYHYNLIGDLGTHYTGTLTYNYSSGEMTVGNTTCN
jgi:hypothetical protein